MPKASVMQLLARGAIKIKKVMKSKKVQMYLYLLLIAVGCVAACSTVIPNDYLKLAVVLVCICVGLFGILKSLGGSADTEEERKDKNDENK
jgi:uncharacterized membrane protein YfcA